ncbi:MAG: hypothetical protein SCH71_16245 [Desulfobulbaceae bacterium]|nr:hypothetical protein [Desulfobulbaceae bacterium]
MSGKNKLDQNYNGLIMDGKNETGKNRSEARLLVFTALAASLLIGGQLYLIALQGEAACFNEGCSVVEELTRVSPFVFNLFGLFFFLVVGLAALLALVHPASLSFLSLLLLAALAAEGVLLAYQYHVAQAWCSYCLIIFGLVALCNLIVGLRQFFSGAVLVAAVNIIFALLRFEPAILNTQDNGLTAGTAAVRTGLVGNRSVSIIYSNDCPHCMTLLQKLPEFTACTVRLNPIGEPPPADIQGLERMTSFQPEMNRLLLRMLQIDSVPVLVLPDNGGYRIIRSESGIDSYLSANCVETAESRPSASELSTWESSVLDGGQSLFPPAGDEECGIDVECEEPVFEFFD